LTPRPHRGSLSEHGGCPGSGKCSKCALPTLLPLVTYTCRPHSRHWKGSRPLSPRRRAASRIGRASSTWMTRPL
jgi:hypothetical protein